LLGWTSVESNENYDDVLQLTLALEGQVTSEYPARCPINTLIRLLCNSVERNITLIDSLEIDPDPELGQSFVKFMHNYFCDGRVAAAFNYKPLGKIHQVEHASPRFCCTTSGLVLCGSESGTVRIQQSWSFSLKGRHGLTGQPSHLPRLT
jgi:hypothetical protein